MAGKTTVHNGARLLCEGHGLLNVRIGAGILAVLFVGRETRKAKHRHGDVTLSFGWQKVAVMDAAEPRSSHIAP